MSKVVDEVIAANKKYASTFGGKKDLALPPARKFAILTCMDARLDPAKYAGLSEGDAHVVRNAGGLTKVRCKRYGERRARAAKVPLGIPPEKKW